MFSGIGGFELGIQKATRDEWECIGYSEINKYAIKVYENHFNHRNYGDATAIDTSKLPDFQFLCGGFPCQTFSTAGKRRGFDDTRGTLFFEIARILRHKRPRHFLLENVLGLLSHDSGKTFTTILGVLTDLGYQLQWQVLNSKDYGVPQNRERVFIVGHCGEGSAPQVFPISEGEKESPHKAKQQGCASTLTTRSAGGGNRRGNYVVKRVPLKFLDRNQKNIEGDYAYTVDTAGTGGITVNDEIRRLTPLECERLQGFPDNWTASISDNQRYKCLGNAVTVNTIEAIIRHFGSRVNCPEFPVNRY